MGRGGLSNWQPGDEHYRPHGRPSDQDQTDYFRDPDRKTGWGCVLTILAIVAAILIISGACARIFDPVEDAPSTTPPRPPVPTTAAPG